MTSHAAVQSPSRAHQIQQIFKWVVYTLLIINWVFYIQDDWVRATHTLTADSTWLDWTSEFATSIDETGWFVLLAMFEIETYWLDDDDTGKWTAFLVRGIRLLCYVMLAHTVYAYANTVVDYAVTNPVDGVSNLCEMTEQDVSHVYNLEYTQVDEISCGDLPADGQLFWLGEDPVVVDKDGLELERDLAWVDLVEVLTWLIILAAIEIVVRLQDRNITGGLLMSSMKSTKVVLYLLLIGFAIYWAWLGHWLYFWDELVWIGGFAAIEMNVSEWKAEILEEQSQVGP